MSIGNPQGEGTTTPSTQTATDATPAPATGTTASTAADTITTKLPDAGGATLTVTPTAAAPTNANANADANAAKSSLPDDATVWILNEPLLGTLEKLGGMMFRLDASGQPVLSPKVREAIALLQNKDLSDANEAAKVDAFCEKALAAYRAYLKIAMTQTTFVDQVRLLIREHDRPHRPIP